ncbi:MAG: glycerol kinase, partial [Bacteroidales bacterium]
ALGAAYLAGLAVGYWGNINEIRNQWQIEKVFSPRLTADKTTSLIAGWHRAVKAAEAWASG